MGKITSILSGIGLLIGVYLFLSHGNATAQIINTIGSTGNSAIKTLQGR